MANKNQKIWSKRYTAPKGHKQEGKTLSIAMYALSATKAQINIIGYIWEYWNGSEDYRLQMEALREQGYTAVHVYMNTGGGSTFEAAEIVNINNDFKANGGTLTGNAGALLASAGTRIAVEIDDFTQARNGLFMIHKPMGHFDGNEDQIEADLKLLRAVTKDYVRAYAERTGKSEDEIKELFKQGDVWMTAEEARDEGFISGINAEAEFTEEELNALKAANYPKVDKIAAQVKPKAANQPPNPKQEDLNTDSEMKKEVLAALLGLGADASEEQIKAKLEELKQNASELSTLKAAQKETEKTQKATKVKALLDKAQNEEKRITAENRPTYEKLAEQVDFETLEATINSMPKVKPLSGEIQEQGPSASTNDGRKDWKYSDWAEKDPQGLQALMKSDVDRFKALYKGHYGVEPSLPENK